MWKGGDFRRQAASALTHPVTVVALGLLLANDLLLKSLWPGAWATGKISDLAWVVFASPLLAFLLSRISCRNPTAERASFLAAYIGLPLLYAAFNTFAPLHDWISRGLSQALSGTSGAPLDSTDSLIIPLGLGVAVWTQRRARDLAARLVRWEASVREWVERYMDDPRWEPGQETTFEVQVADTEAARTQGLTEREALLLGQGLWLAYETARIPRNPMRGMRFPIDIIWVSDALHVAATVSEATTEYGERYSPSKAVRYALMVNAGTVERYGITSGDPVWFNADG